MSKCPVMALAALLVYLLLPTKNYYWDGVGFALTIEAPDASLATLIHPNHPFYSVMGYGIWKLLTAAGLKVRALFVLQALNAFFAAAAVLLFSRILLLQTRSPVRAWIGTLIFAFSATWWTFSSDVNAYIPSVFFLLVCFTLLILDRPHPLSAGLAHGAAMVFHQLSLFFFPVAIVAFLFPPWNRAPSRRLRFVRLLLYCVAAIVPATLIYTLGFRSAAAETGQRFWDWVTTHAHDSAFSFHLLRGAQLTLRGTVRLFFGGKLNYVKLDYLTISVVLALIAVLLYIGRSSRLNSASGQNRFNEFHSWISENRLLLVWIISYMAFLWIWLPHNTFYRLFYLPALVLPAASFPWRPGLSRVLASACAIMIACNLLFSIYPHSKIENNEVLAFALDTKSNWRTSGSTVLYGQFHSDLWTIRYFNPQVSWILMPSPTIAWVEKYRSETPEPGAVWLEATAYAAIEKLPGGREWLNEHVDRFHSQQFISSKAMISFYRLQ